MSGTEPFTPSEREVVERTMKDCYKQFTEKAAAGRNMDIKQLDSLAGGRLYSGIMAKEKHLVDELGTLDDAVADAKRLAGLKDDDKIERLILPKPKSFLEGLLGNSAVSSQAPPMSSQASLVAAVKSAAPELFQQLGLEQLAAAVPNPREVTVSFTCSGRDHFVVPGSALSSEQASPLYARIQSAPGVLQLPLLDERFPDGPWKLIGRHNAHDGGFIPGTHRPAPNA
jgi:hypothetical protein